MEADEAAGKLEIFITASFPFYAESRGRGEEERVRARGRARLYSSRLNAILATETSLSRRVDISNDTPSDRGRKDGRESTGREKKSAQLSS